MTIWFSGDHHFYHGKILSYCNRPFLTASECAEVMIKNWNEQVDKQDKIYYLGDLAFLSKNQLSQLLDKLNGKIYLIKGNHDHKVLKEDIVNKFEWVKDYYELSIQDKINPKKNQFIILQHYPLLTWNGMSHHSWHLHAHCHGNINELNNKCLRLDVGVDNFNFKLASLEQVQDIMNEKKFKLFGK